MDGKGGVSGLYVSLEVTFRERVDEVLHVAVGNRKAGGQGLSREWQGRHVTCQVCMRA